MDFTDQTFRALIARAEAKLARQQEALDLTETELRFYKECLAKQTVKK